MTREEYDRYFKINSKNEVIFIGEKLEVFIPERYKDKELMTVTSDISTIAIFHMVVDDKITVKYFLPAFIKIVPSSIDIVLIDEERYVKATLVKNDVWMANRELLRVEKVAYLIWNEFIYWGNIPKWMSYEDVLQLFQTLQDVTGLNFDVPSVVFQTIVSHLARSQKNLDEQYRLTDMKEPPQFIPLHSVAHAATSVTARIIGSYFDDSINVSLLQDKGQTSELEDILRS